MKRPQDLHKDHNHRISAVSAMTRLLAFNTMLEAARIGTEGKGFAHVADELTAISHRPLAATPAGEAAGWRSAPQTSEEIDTAIQDQLHAMEDLNTSMSSITQLAAEITRSPGQKTLPRKELLHLYEILGADNGKDIA